MILPRQTSVQLLLFALLLMLISPTLAEAGHEGDVAACDTLTRPAGESMAQPLPCAVGLETDLGTPLQERNE